MLLPPNVFYLEVLFEGDLLRAKYAVLTLADFRKGAERWFHSYLWGRIAQKTSIIFTRDELDARYVKQALACAVSRFIAQALPCMNSSFTARELWSKGLSLSYRAELRPEDAERAAERLFDDDPAYYQSLTTLILQASPAVVTVDDDPGCSCYQLTLPEQARR